MTCPLCDSERARASWLGSVFYRGKEFPYVQCLACNSLYCNPMPDKETLAQMYGPEYYDGSYDTDLSAEGTKDPLEVVKWLKKSGGGTFIDYGCGTGALLTEAIKLNWEAIGVEFDEEVAKTVEAHTGAKVVNSSIELGGEPSADILHLGDVIEHLTETNQQMPEILRLIKPGGLLLAQGPLEANTNLFAFVLRVARSLKRSRRTEMAPYHVMLATAEGQRKLFERLGLKELEFTIHEVAWPAPSRLSRSELRRPRLTGLFVLRRLSQMSSAFRPSRWGNRYFYVGRRDSQAARQQ